MLSNSKTSSSLRLCTGSTDNPCKTPIIILDKRLDYINSAFYYHSNSAKYKLNARRTGYF